MKENINRGSSVLKIGDKIFLANYGAGVVKEVGLINNISEKEEYVKIFLVFDKMSIFLPKNKLSTCKYRKISSKEDMKKNIEIIFSEPENIEKNWNARYRKNREKLHGLNINAICYALRDLYFLKMNLMLPQGEEKILERAEGLVVSELSMVMNLKYSEVLEKLRNENILKEMNNL